MGAVLLLMFCQNLAVELYEKIEVIMNDMFND